MLSLISQLQQVAERAARTKLFKVVQFAVIGLFVFFVGRSLLQLFRSDITPNWPVVLGASILGGGLVQITNAAEFHQLAKFSGATVTPQQSFMTTLYSTLVNQLPIPGSIAVRVSVMKRQGASTRAISLGTVVVAGMYLSINILATGLALVIRGTVLFAIVVLTAGIGGLAISIGIGTRQRLANYRRWTISISTIELVLVLVSAGRLYVVLWGLGFSTGIMTAVVLTVASAVAVAVGVLPVGLGVREALMALMAPLVSLSAVATTTAAIFERTFRLAVVALSLVVSQLMGFRRRDLIEDQPTS